jgi:hypothetical protein
MSRRFLYRKSGPAVIVILAMSLVTLTRSGAQERPQLKRPQQDVPQEKPSENRKTKKVKGPRAVALVQLNSSGKATLIPIAILIDGRFYDASVYKADPVPMALEGGTVYEVEQAGQSQGLFTIRGALHSKSPGNPSPWLGAGSYVVNGAEVAKTTHAAENVPVGLDNSTDAPPRLTRGKESKEAAAHNPSPAPGSDTPAPAGTSEKPGTGPAASSQPASGSSAGGASTPEVQKPAAPSASDKATKQETKGPESAGQASQSQESQTYYRPTLRRGKPSEPAPQEDEPAPKVDKIASPPTAAATTQEPVQLLPAISDAGGPDPQPYKFFWKEGEEDERRKQMLEMAAGELRAYVIAREKGAIPAQPPVAKAGATTHKSAVKPAQPLFENIQFRTFDVWRNNQPVMIFSAEAHLSPTPGGTATPELYSVSLVARSDIYGNLRKLYSGVTDKFHLDVTPRLELLDAVDADGDGRGELLFRETTDAGNGYVIYRATADKLWKLFDSLRAE